MARRSGESVNTFLVPFPPLGNPHIVGIGSGPVLSLDQSIELALAVEDVPDGELVYDEVIDVVVPLMTELIAACNSAYFDFEISAVRERGEPSVVRVSDEGRRLAELSCSDTASNRKLTVILPIAMEGADARFAVEGFGKERPVEVGVGLAFPSYLVPRIDLCPSSNSDDATTGNAVNPRLVALVMHALGPAFR